MDLDIRFFHSTCAGFLVLAIQAGKTCHRMKILHHTFVGAPHEKKAARIDI